MEEGKEKQTVRGSEDTVVKRRDPHSPSLKRFAADARPRTSRLNAEMQRCSLPAFTTTSGRVVCVVLLSLPIQQKKKKKRKRKRLSQ
jgi:hypothetical protein